MAEFEARRAELEKVQAEKLGGGEAVAENWKARALGIASKAGVDGRLFS